MKNSIISAFKLIWQVSNKKERFYLIGLFFLSLLRTIRSLITPLILACIVSKLSNEPAFFIFFNFSDEISTIGLICILFIIYCLSAIIESGVRALIKLFSAKMMGKVNTYAVDTILEPRKNTRLNITNGEINYIIKSASENVCDFIERSMVEILVPLFSCVISIIYIVSVEILTLPVLMVALTLVGLLVYFRMFRDKKIFSKLEKLNEKTSNNSLNIIENLPFINFIKSRKREVEIERDLNARYYKNEKKRIITYILYWAGIYLVQTVSFVVILYLVINKTLTTAEIISIIIVIFTYLTNIFNYVTSFGFALGAIQQRAIKICRIYNLVPKQEELIEKCEKLPSNVKIENIKIKDFTIKIGEICNSNISFALNKGEINCIIGKSGSGKSTLINCLLGINEYPEGTIIVNDKYEIQSFFFENERFSIAFQDSYFFDRSVKENLSYPDAKLSDSALRLIKYFKLEELMNRKYNFSISEESDTSFKNTFSGGEKRRFNLVRCLSKKAEVYILDEPTNDLDAKNVSRLLKLLNQLKDKAIVVIISHDERIMDISTNKIELSRKPKTK